MAERRKPGAVLINAHAIARLRERHDEAAAWTDERIYREVVRWIGEGIELGGQYGERKVVLHGTIAIVILHKRNGQREVRSILTREQALANVEAFVVKPVRKGRGRRHHGDQRRENGEKPADFQ